MKPELFAFEASAVTVRPTIHTSMRYKYLAYVIGLSAAFTSPFAFSQTDKTAQGGFDFRAEPRHWYIGGNYGHTLESINDGKIANSIIGGGLTDLEDEDSDRGYKFFVGYQFNDHIALEAGYADLGDFGLKVARAPDTGTMTGATSYKGYNLDLVGTWPLTQRLSAFGRVGAFRYETEENFVGTESLAASLSRDDKDTGYKFGAGLEYSFTERLSARLEAERYRIEDMLGDHGSVNLYSVGLVYRFGDRAAPHRHQKKTQLLRSKIIAASWRSSLKLIVQILHVQKPSACMLPVPSSKNILTPKQLLRATPITSATISSICNSHSAALTACFNIWSVNKLMHRVSLLLHAVRQSRHPPMTQRQVSAITAALIPLSIV
jgi:opacity protein-like surface antigen